MVTYPDPNLEDDIFDVGTESSGTDIVQPENIGRVTTGTGAGVNTMPTTLNNLQNMVRFWIPVWLAYHTWLDIKSPKWITSDWSLINDGKSTIPISANQSQFSPIFKKQFDKLIPAMPDLKLSSNDNRLFQNELRRKLLERSASAT